MNARTEAVKTSIAKVAEIAAKHGFLDTTTPEEVEKLDQMVEVDLKKHRSLTKEEIDQVYQTSLNSYEGITSEMTDQQKAIFTKEFYSDCQLAICDILRQLIN